MRFVSIILLATYGTLSLLGHGGLHALLHTDGCSCSAGGTQHCAQDDEICATHGDQQHSDNCRGKHSSCPWSNASTEDCDHGARQAKSAFPFAADTANDIPIPDRPLHDSKNCRICEWCLSSQAVACQITSVQTETPVESRLLLACCHADYSSPLTTTPRGPPGC